MERARKAIVLGAVVAIAVAFFFLAPVFPAKVYTERFYTNLYGCYPLPVTPDGTSVISASASYVLFGYGVVDVPFTPSLLWQPSPPHASETCA